MDELAGAHAIALGELAALSPCEHHQQDPQVVEAQVVAHRALRLCGRQWLAERIEQPASPVGSRRVGLCRSGDVGEHGRVAVLQVDDGVEELKERLGAVGLGGSERLKLRHEVLEHRDEERVARGEVAVKRGAPDAGSASDVVKRDIHAVSAKDGVGGGDDRGAARKRIGAHPIDGAGLCISSTHHGSLRAGTSAWAGASWGVRSYRPPRGSLTGTIVPVTALLSQARPNPSITLATLALATLAYSLLQSLVSPALPDIQRELNGTPNGAAWVLTGYLLAAAIATPIVGRLGDVHGKKRLLVLSLIVLALGTVVAAIASSLWLLILARIIQGVGGGILPLSFGIIRDEFPKERVAGSIGTISALLGLGGGLGVVLSGVIVDNLSYHWIFWFPFVGIVIALVVVIIAVPESEQRAPAGINWVGAALMSIGMALLLFGVSRTSAWGWGSARTIGFLVGGAVALALWVQSERRSATPLVDMKVMAVRGVWTTNLVAVLIGGAMFMGFVLLPQFVQADPSGGYGFGSSVTASGVFLLPMAVSMLVVGALAGKIEHRVGSRPPLIAGVLFTAASFVVMLAAHSTKAPLYIGSALLGIGIGLAFAAMANLIVASVPQSQTGVATGMNTVARSVGGAFGSQLGATLLASSVTVAGLTTVQGFEHAFELAIGWLAVALLVALLIPSHANRQDDIDTALAGPSPAKSA